jgi:V-type H+-transporting ATPase subunit a
VNHTLRNGTVVQVAQLATVAVKKEGWADVYPFGVDPTWHSADNDLLFFNSLKMKMSVVIGIIQMTFGLVLKLMNAIHFGSKADLFLEAIPQLIFMVALFGYMVFLIILKWCINWNDPATSPGAPPSLIDTLINVVLKPGTVNDQMFASQPSLQVLILLIVFFTVPIMLFGKPLAAHYAGKAAKKRHEEEQALMGGGSTLSLSGAAHGQQVDTGALVVAGGSAYSHEGAINGGAAGTGLHQRITSPGVESPTAGLVKANPSGGAVATAGGHGHGGGGHDDGHGAGGEHHSFGDVFVHQAIETIEFVLGSVSNTASYLRLWALSLAHSQLATVFWERALVSQIETGNFFLIFIGWGAFACVTIGVLLLMDVLECFLHALRLHWVEFQNKFYKADGYKFMPFSFAALAEVEE